MNTYHPFSLTTPSTLMIQDWTQTNQNNRQVIAGFTTKNGGVSQKPFESLNTGLHVHDKDADVVKNREYIADMLILICSLGYLLIRHMIIAFRK